jgi:uncharacterized damage-inducible protein DinB
MPETERKHPDMWLEPEDDPRGNEPAPPGELGVLTDYLRHYRLTLELKCDGLDAEQLARRSVPPSTMSLLGLVRHMAGVEWYWFQYVMSGVRGPERPFRTREDRDHDFNAATGDPEQVREAFDALHAEIAAAEQVVRDAASLDVEATDRHGQTVTLREVLVHMIEEYARHAGHADLLRECIDGRTGQ